MSKIISASDAAVMSKRSVDEMIELFNNQVKQAVAEGDQHFYILQPNFGGEFTNEFLDEIRKQGYVLNWYDYGYDTIGVFWGQEAEWEQKRMEEDE